MLIQAITEFQTESNIKEFTPVDGEEIMQTKMEEEVTQEEVKPNIIDAGDDILKSA